MVACLWYVVLPYVFDEFSRMVSLLSNYATHRLDVNYLPREVHDFLLQYIDVERIAGLLSKEQWMKLISGFASVGNLSALAFQSNLPPSTIMPPSDEPCPPRNFVAE